VSQVEPWAMAYPKNELAHSVGHPGKTPLKNITMAYIQANSRARWNSVSDTGSRLWVGRSVVGTPVEPIDFFSSPKRPDGLVDPPCFPCNEYRGCLSGIKRSGRLPPMLRMSGAIDLLPLYAYMAWTKTTLPLSLPTRDHFNGASLF
jgi:hypothetical protein